MALFQKNPSSLSKESNVEAFRIIHSGMSLALQRSANVPLVHHKSTIIALIRKIYSGTKRCIPDCIFRNASVPWPVVCTTRICRWSSQKNVFYHVFWLHLWLPNHFSPTPPYKYPSKPHHFSHHPSPPLLPSTTMVFHRWPFIDKGLVENFQGLYERSMRMEPRCNEGRFIWGSCGSVWFLASPVWA